MSRFRSFQSGFRITFGDSTTLSFSFFISCKVAGGSNVDITGEGDLGCDIMISSGGGGMWKI